jgi:hypothetical protein
MTAARKMTLKCSGRRALALVLALLQLARLRRCIENATCLSVLLLLLLLLLLLPALMLQGPKPLLPGRQRAVSPSSWPSQ